VLRSVEKSGKGWKRLEIIIGIEIGGFGSLDGGYSCVRGGGVRAIRVQKKGGGGRAIDLHRVVKKNCEKL